MRSSTLLALTAAVGPLAVLSSPHPPPPVWEIEIITISFDDTQQLYRPPGRPATATTSSSGAIITSGTEKDESGDDECENEDSLSSTTSAIGANSLTGGASINSLPTTLSTVVADKLRRQIEDLSSSTTSAAVAGVSPPAGFSGTDYPTPTSSLPAGGDSIKKLKNCNKGPVKLKSGTASLSGSSLTDAMPAVTGMSSAAMSSSSAVMSLSSATM